MKYPYFLGLLAAGLLLGGCSSAPDPMDDGGRIKYPYQASPERRDQIMKGVKSLYLGMTEADVIKTLGEADESSLLYYNSENFEKKQSDGKVLIYLLQRLEPFGGIAQRKEIAFRLEFSKDSRLKRVEANDVPGVPNKFLPR